MSTQYKASRQHAAHCGSVCGEERISESIFILKYSTIKANKKQATFFSD
jgi:hypothetical protein